MTTPIGRGQLGPPMTNAEYADEWKATSASFKKGNDYTWMAGQLIGSTEKWTLEIGCGTGESTISIANTGRRVISIEANPALALMAEKNLINAGISVSKINISALTNAIHQSDKRVLVVETTVLDPLLNTSLPVASLSEIACWNIGAAPETVASSLAISLSQIQSAHMAQYREMIQKHLAVLSNTTLTPDGSISFVDRLMLSPPLTANVYFPLVVKMYEGILGTTHEIRNPNLRQVQEDFAKRSQIQYVTAKTTSAQVVPTFVAVNAFRKV
jgi:hypothetical protein